MAPPDHAENPARGPSNVPTLINDYRAQRDAWRAQARGLARMREEVLAAADREARDIVTAARDDVRHALVKARRNLLVLAAQVQAAIDTSQESGPNRAGDVDEALPVQADDLRDARDVFALARHDVRRVLNDARPDIEALSSEAGALRSHLPWQAPALNEAPPSEAGALRPSLPWQPPALNDAPSRVVTPPSGVVTPPAPDFEFELPATPELPVVSPPDPIASPPDAIASPPDPAALRRDSIASPLDPIAVPRSVSTFVLAFVGVGMAVLITTGWWLRSMGGDDASPQQTVEPVAGLPASQPAVGAIDARPQTARIDKPTALSVTIEARRVAWIRATVDGRVASARMFESGEKQHITAARDVSIQAGDAGAVFVSVNGGRASALGSEGQVVTRRFVFEEASESVGTSSPPLTANTRVVPNEGATREEATPPRLPASLGSDARPQTGALEVNAARAPLAINPVPPVIRPETPPKAAVAAAGGTGTISLQDDFVRAAERWLDAYYRRDRSTLATFSDAQVSVSDERTDNERLAQGLAGVHRSFEDVNFQVFGESAIFTAKMTERWENIAAARMAMSDSFVSQIWTRRTGKWQLSDVRIVGASTLNRIFR